MDLFLKYRNLKVVSVVVDNMKINNRLSNIRVLRLMGDSTYIMFGHRDGDSSIKFDKLSVGIHTFRHILEKYSGENIVLVANITPQCNLLLDEYDTCVEIIDVDMFLFEKYLSRLVPMYIKLSEEEIIRTMKKLCINRSQFSKITPKDPIVYILGLRTGDVVKIKNQQKWRVVI